jgi:membrane peptidoglycan carboxypeptidase
MKEDTHLYRLIRERVAVPDQGQAVGVMASTVPQDRFPELVTWMFPLLGHDDRENMTRIWQMVMPADAFAGATALGLLVMTVAATACGLPKLEDAQPRVLAQTSFLYAADGSLITELHAGEDRVVLAYAQMPQSIKDATVAIEDQRFWYHHGVDGRALLRAAYINLRSGRIVEGGSTITQQLVKNLYVGDERTFGRKIDEAALAWQLDEQLTKEQILAKYLIGQVADFQPDSDLPPEAPPDGSPNH